MFGAQSPQRFWPRVRRLSNYTKYTPFKYASQADGSVLATSRGGTSVLAAAVSPVKPASTDTLSNFLPLQVEFFRRSFAHGHFPENFMRRETFSSPTDTLISRAVDRAIRPRFPPGYFGDTQVITTLVSWNKKDCVYASAINATSAALTVSDIPFEGPIAAVRAFMRKADGQVVFAGDPQPDEELSDPVSGYSFETLPDQFKLNLLYAGSKEGVVMIEAEGYEFTELELRTAMEASHRRVQELILEQEAARQAVGKPKRELPPSSAEERFGAKAVKAMKSIVEVLLPEILSSHSLQKLEQVNLMQQMRVKAVESFLSDKAFADTLTSEQAQWLCEKVEHDLIRTHMLGKNFVRMDGRDPAHVRPLFMELGILPHAHGSAFFQRGGTQVMCAATLGNPMLSLNDDSVFGVSGSKPLILHYEFPPYCVNEIRPLARSRRRELGHGALAEKSLLYAMLASGSPPTFAVRVNSIVTGSSGSSSMASVCGGTLALVNAGIRTEYAAGVSVGLVTGKGKKKLLLVDILGFEDYHGDMDFKIAGTRKGITGIQLDIKIPSVPIETLYSATVLASRARVGIIEQMEAAVEVSEETTPVDASESGVQLVSETVEIAVGSMGRVIGKGGSVIQSIRSISGTTIVTQDNQLAIVGPDSASIECAKELIEYAVHGPKEGVVYQCQVTDIDNSFVRVKLLNLHGFPEVLSAHEVVSRQEQLSRTFQIGDVFKAMRRKDMLTNRVILSRKPLLSSR